MEELLALVRQIVPSLTEDDISVPIEELGLDSLDLTEMRISFERYYNTGNTNTVIEKKTSIINNFYKYKKIASKENNKSELLDEITISRTVKISLPEMADTGLSENWLLKHLGHLHWELLAQAYETALTNITDGESRVYATFLRACYSFPDLRTFSEDSILHFNASMTYNGGTFFTSKIIATAQEGDISANLLTSFCKNDGHNNLTPLATVNTQPRMRPSVQLPSILSDHKLINKGLLDIVSLSSQSFEISDTSIASSSYKINPFYDINGVGLLYFAAYPIISDFALIASNHLASTRATRTSKDVCYFSNITSSCDLLVELNPIQYTEGGFFYSTSILRTNDRKKVARIFVYKESPAGSKTGDTSPTS